MLRILSFKQFANLKGRNGMQKKKMQSKRMQIKPALNVKLTLNVTANITFRKRYYFCLNGPIF